MAIDRVDPEGLDLACGDATLRLAFPQRVTGTDDLRTVMVDLAKAARSAR